MPSGLKNYDVEIDGVIEEVVPAPGTSLLVVDRTPNTPYVCRVRARDNAGNVSAWSEPLNVTTAEVNSDTTPPTVPTGLNVTSISDTGGNLTWVGSTDDNAVTKYQVRVNGVVLGDESTVTSRTLTGLTPNMQQNIEVRAGDASDNWSNWSATYSFSTLETGVGIQPIAAWAFDEGTGTIANDSIGSRDINSASLLWDPNGRNGQAAAYSGAGPIQIPIPAGLQTPHRTLMFWVKKSTDSTGWWCQFYISSLDTAAWGIGRISGSLFTRIRIAGSSTSPTNTDLPINVWHHVAITYDGASFRSYLNGNQYNSTPVTGTIDTADQIRIFDGQLVNNTWIDNLRMYDVALTAAEIQEAMNTPVV